MIDFDGNSLYPTSMADSESICPKFESEYGFTEDLNDSLSNLLNNQSFPKR